MAKMVNKPRMIIFDYGQTLINEKKFDSIKGNRAVLERATKNPHNVTAEEIQVLANKMSKEVGRAFGENNRNKQLLEIPAHSYDKYLYEYFDLEFDTDMDEIQYIFWSNAVSETCETTEGIEELLKYLREKGIRTAVVSNMMNSSKNLQKWINKMIPGNHFEFL